MFNSMLNWMESVSQPTCESGLYNSNHAQDTCLCLCVYRQIRREGAVQSSSRPRTYLGATQDIVHHQSKAGALALIVKKQATSSDGVDGVSFGFLERLVNSS